MFVAATHKNWLSAPLRCYISAIFWRTQTTKPAEYQLEESDPVRDSAISEVSPSQVRAFEDMPGPKRSVMSFVELYRKSEGLTKGYKLNEALIAKYGPIFKENYTGETQVHISDPDDFEKVLRADGKYPRRMILQFWYEHRARRNHFPGIFQLDGEEWHRIRRNIAPKMMRPKVVEENLDNFNLVADDAMARFVELKEACGPDDHIPDIEEELRKYALESIGTMAFDTRLGLYSDPPSPEAQKFIVAVQDFFELSQKLLLSIPSNLLRPYMDTPTLKKFFKVADEILDIGKAFVDRKVKELKETTSKGIESSGKVVPLLIYLLTKDELSEEEVNGMAIDVVTGGVDTTSNTLLWMLYHLGRLPHIQEKLHQEVDRVVGKEKHITPDKIAKLSYLKAFLKESMRVTPIFTLSSRLLQKDVVLSGYRVPANTHILFELYCMGNSEKYFKDASEFRPERWLSENRSQNHAFSSLQFGHGVRMCIGRRVAEVEVYVLICKLLQEFRIEYTGEPLEILQKMTSCPDKPVKVKFVDRG
ncbi:PREDICTED: cytochrome P450 10-like [Acropora digitifera]|uniref:cytochrome P450 10-like n=1 Tax=Acropora digitifera TaxID=70779 RepID=UPI00077B2576|nr:PREDICTED: cytochrome P450 10-like [Acropora digitifera]